MTSGKVTKASTEEGIVEITGSNGVKVTYSGLKSISVKKGKDVKKGAAIGKTKADLGIGIEDSKGNSVDPTPIFAVMGDGSQSFNYNKVVTSIESVKGYPYNMVGNANDKSSGYFDCSGLMQWAFKQTGIHLPRTAQEQYDYTTKISESEARPGDLVFFQGTYNAGHPITHVGIYIGNGQFWNANSSGVTISALTGYWREHKPVFGRVTH